jgi:hypothetical protein
MDLYDLGTKAGIESIKYMRKAIYTHLKRASSSEHIFNTHKWNRASPNPYSNTPTFTSKA